MALSALQLFRVLADEFELKTNDQVNTMVEVVTGRLDLTAYGDRLQEALARAAAHEFEMTARRKSSPAGWSSVGPVRSVSTEVSSMVVGEGKAPVNSHEGDEYGQTSQGRALLQIRDSQVFSFGVFT